MSSRVALRAGLLWCHLKCWASDAPINKGGYVQVAHLVHKVPEELWSGRLALHLLAHRVRGSYSPFAPYIAHLPLGIAGLPMFFSPQARAAFLIRVK